MYNKFVIYFIIIMYLHINYSKMEPAVFLYFSMFCCRTESKHINLNRWHTLESRYELNEGMLAANHSEKCHAIPIASATICPFSHPDKQIAVNERVRTSIRLPKRKQCSNSFNFHDKKKIPFSVLEN